MTNATYTGPRRVATKVMSVTRSRLRAVAVKARSATSAGPLGTEVWDRGSIALTTNHTEDAKLLHQPLHTAACDPDAVPVELLPDLVDSVGTIVLMPHTHNLDLE